MNEKIKEFAEQCFLFDGYGAAIPTYGNEELQQFAQSIIQKCANIAMSYSNASSFDEYDDLSEYDRGCDDTAALISSRIKGVFK